LKGSFFSWTLGGIFQAVFFPVLMILVFGFYYMDLQLKVGADRFFHHALERVSSWERSYAQQLAEIESHLLRSIKGFRKKAAKPLNREFYRGRDQYFYGRSELLTEYAKELEGPFRRKLLLSLLKIRKETLKKFPKLKSEDFFLQFYGYDIGLLYSQINREIGTNAASNSLIRLDPQHRGITENLFQSLAILILRRSIQQKSAKIAFKALKYNFNYPYEKNRFQFSSFLFRPLALRVMVGDIELSRSGRRRLGIEEWRWSRNVDVNKLPRGCLSIAINIQNFFPQTMLRLSTQNPLVVEEVESSYVISSIPSTPASSLNPFKGFKNIQIFDTHRTRSVNAKILSKELFLSRKTLRFSYVDAQGEPRFGIACPDTILRGFIHFFSVSKPELAASYRNFVKVVLLSILVIFSLFLASAILLARGFSRPLQDFAQKVEETSSDLNPSQIESFSHHFIEFGIMRNTFLAKVRNLSRRFFLAGELARLQSCIQSHPNSEDFLAMVSEIYKDCFSQNFLDYDPETSTLRFGDRRVELRKKEEIEKGLGLWTLQSEGQEMEPFHEQVRFFFESRALEGQYKTALKTEQEFLISRQIQRELLPGQLPQTRVLSSAAYFQPAKTLGGDFFDHHSLPDREIFVIADVSGKGLGSALYAAFVKAMLYVLCASGRPLNRVLSHLHRDLEGYGDKGYFCTLFLAGIDAAGERMEYSSAGHNRMILLRGGFPIFLSGKGLPVGILSGPEHSLERMDLEVGDLIFLYTDGVTELEGSGGELFGEKRLLEILEDGIDDSMEDLKSRIIQRLTSFSFQGQLSDDVTFLIIKVRNQDAPCD